MDKVFFGKVDGDATLNTKSYGFMEKDWYKGIDVGDYLFVKRKNEAEKGEAVVNYLWKAKQWQQQGDLFNLEFEEIAFFNNTLPLKKFIALDIFKLDKNLLNFTNKTVKGCIGQLTATDKAKNLLKDPVQLENYLNGNPVRAVRILSDPAEIDSNSIDIQLVINKNTKQLYKADFITDELYDSFDPDNFVASGKGSTKQKLYDMIVKGKKTISFSDTPLVGFYDLFCTKIKQKETTDKTDRRKAFVEFCEANGAQEAASQYENGIRAIEKEFSVDAEDEFAKDHCFGLQNKVENMQDKSGNRRNWPSYLKKYIQYMELCEKNKKQLDLQPQADKTQIISYKNPYSNTLMKAKNIIFRGAPGTGKSYLAKEIAADIVSNGTKRKDNELSEEEKQQIAFVQFHPSYDYSDFVEGLRPSLNPDGSMGFALQSGVFKLFVDKARKNYDNSNPLEKNDKKEKQDREARKNYVFIIDEINRGEISKILGELFFSIDPGYRGEAGAVSTQYANLHPNEKFYIPENVYIIGTMNDIDRSVDTFDFAMRRRFRFIEIKAEDRLEMLDDLAEKEKAIRRMRSLNSKIEQAEGLGRNYQIGAAYFRKLKDLNGEADPFRVLWLDYLEPLLQEYVNGLPNDTELMQQFENAYNCSDTTEGYNNEPNED